HRRCKRDRLWSCEYAKPRVVRESLSRRLPAEHRNRTTKRIAGNEVVHSRHFKVSAQQRNQHLHQLRMFEHFARRSIHLLEFGNKFRLGQIVNLGSLFRKLRGSASGDKEVVRFKTTLCAQAAREFETDTAAHAVTEEG